MIPHRLKELAEQAGFRVDDHGQVIDCAGWKETKHERS